ncbi:HAD family phosphatase [Thermanaerothrix sp. 4228-RoL]|uniref:HAD family phosphatase n=1 Tax=Thermanaerothrix solaris TaxID=3058434 RepID=A0ABU3NPK8_9CHLR|nr:HAD family phosphatase [Thermanaerothrix sp. 4228-RoL]MDT8897741.1 HAD family phosphatase [Thermanaerothrix sp. 4228-RoL]
MIKAVIFDMGGVLLRTEDPTPRTQLAGQYGLSVSALENLVFNSESSIRAERGEISEQEHWAWVCAQLGLPPSAIQDLQTQFWAGDRLDTELVTFIKNLRPHIKTGLLSNAWTGTRQIVEARYGFLDAFDVVIFSAEVGMRKPDAQIFHHTLKQLQVAPHEAVFVDDLLPNVEGARRVGLHAIHFTHPTSVREAIQALLDHHFQPRS